MSREDWAPSPGDFRDDPDGAMSNVAHNVAAITDLSKEVAWEQTQALQEQTWVLEMQAREAGESRILLRNIDDELFRIGRGVTRIELSLDDIVDLQKLHLGVLATGFASVAALELSTRQGLKDVARGIANLDLSVIEVGDRVERVVRVSADAVRTAIAKQTADVTGAIHEQTVGLLVGVEWQTRALATVMLAVSDRNHADLVALRDAVKSGFASRLALEAEERFCDAQTNFELKLYSRALKDLRKALDAKSTHIGSWVLLGRIAEVMGQNGRAVRVYCHAIELCKKTKEKTYEDMARCLLLDLEYRQDNLDACVEYLEGGWAKMPDRFFKGTDFQHSRFRMVQLGFQTGRLTSDQIQKAMLRPWPSFDAYERMAKYPLFAGLLPDTVRQYGVIGIFVSDLEELERLCDSAKTETCQRFGSCSMELTMLGHLFTSGLEALSLLLELFRREVIEKVRCSDVLWLMGRGIRFLKSAWKDPKWNGDHEIHGNPTLIAQMLLSDKVIEFVGESCDSDYRLGDESLCAPNCQNSWRLLLLRKKQYFGEDAFEKCKTAIQIDKWW